ncbi:MAG: tRNA 2-thiouridine(34) synthase MnmA [Candidatus Nealsonbacteria bacterium]
MPKKVIVAMSGGVDSSVAAALLRKQGFQVTGVFMKLNNVSGDALSRAENVARILKIPFLVLDLMKEFKKEVIDYFLKEYEHGRTPNPCVICNKEIKFNCLFKLKADFFATGHYAKIKNGRLFMAKDKLKDQSYFLWKLNQNQLKRVLFPIGDYTKPEVRKLAKKFKLPVAETPESQDICFNIPPHIKFYTIGQRKGLGLSGGPFWVLGRDKKKNLILTKNEKDLFKKELRFRNASWLSGKPPKLPAKIKAKIRSRSELASAAVYEDNRVIFAKPQRAITPGQSIVFYNRRELIGGGVIC